MKTIGLFFFLLCTSRLGFAQQTEYNRLKLKVKNELTQLGTWLDDSRNGKTEIDADSLANSIANHLVRLLKCEESRNLDPKEFHGLDLSVRTDDSTRIRLYSFGYVCGGTRGQIDFSVIQWCNKQGKLFAYNLSKNVYLAFHSTAYLLKKDTLSSVYLLMGMEQDNTTHLTYGAIILKFSGDYLFTNYPAFANRFDLLLTNAAISYNPGTRTLHIAPSDYEYTRNAAWELEYPQYAEYPNDTAGNRRYYHLITDNYENEYGYAESIDLWFNGTRFVNRTQPAKQQ